MACRALYTYGRRVAPKFRQMTRIALAALLLLAAQRVNLYSRKIHPVHPQKR